MREYITRYWLEVIFGFALSGIGFCFRGMYAQFKALKLGMQAILRDRIIEQYNKWTEKDFIPIYALENVEAMYLEYHALGGNGTITKLYEELQELSKRKMELM